MGGNCFVKPLDRDSTKPPADFWDLIQKIRVSSCIQYSRACVPTSSFGASSNNVVFVSFCFQSGYYMPNEKEVKSSYRIAGSPVPDARVFGM